MAEAKKVLLINTHLTYPNWTEGTLNNSLNQKAKDFFEAKGFEVLETKIENGYNADEEVEKHLQADIVILQTPVNWFGTPWIYKKYVDEVFNSGLASKKFLTGDGRTREDATKQYGTGGLMQGKKFMICATFNAPAEAFDNPTQVLMQGKSTADLFLNISSNYKFCGYDILTGYNCFDIYKNGDIANEIANYPTHLAKAFHLSTQTP
ncbi:MAG: flavodoxin [Chitinophagaceae bacterium]|nr:MAG: flavodoxin [Chitinophagaceae bacterium]